MFSYLSRFPHTSARSAKPTCVLHGEREESQYQTPLPVAYLPENTMIGHLKSNARSLSTLDIIHIRWSERSSGINRSSQHLFNVYGQLYWLLNGYGDGDEFYAVQWNNITYSLWYHMLRQLTNLSLLNLSSLVFYSNTWLYSKSYIS